MITNKRPNFKRLAIVAGLTLVIGLAVFLYIMGFVEEDTHPTSRNVSGTFVDYLINNDYHSDPSHIWEKFQELHGFPFDSRIKLAYKYTLELGMKIFLNQTDPKTNISVTRQGNGWQVNIASKSPNLDLEGHLLGKLPPLAQASFSQRELLDSALKQTPLTNSSSVSFEEIDRLIKEFNTISILKALLKLDQFLADGEQSPDLFFRVSRCYSWLAIFQQFEKSDISKELCAKALANYNIGRCLGGKGQTEWLLILAAMDYWGEAEQILKSQTPETETVLWEAISAWIHYDVKTLKVIVGNHPEMPYFYLLGIVCEATQRNMKAFEIVEPIYLKNKQCIQFLGLLTKTAPLSSNHEYTQIYPELMIERHKSFLDEFGEKDLKSWGSGVVKGFKQNRFSTSESELLEYWLKEKSTTQFVHNKKPILLDIDTYKRLAKAEIFEALWVRFGFLLSKYAVLEESKELMEDIVKVYPDESLTNFMQGLYYEYIAKHEKSKEYYIKALKHDPPKCVLRNTLINYKEWKEGDKLAYQALNDWRDKFFYKSVHINDFSISYKELGYYCLAYDYLKSAKELNPLFPYFSMNLTNWSKDPKYMEECLKKTPENYDLIKMAGKYYQKRKNPDDLQKAVILFNKAIEMSPQSDDAYRYLSDVYLKQKKYSEAIDTLKSYLKYDDKTLIAVHVQNEIGYIYRKQKDYQKAYEIYKEVAPSWQGGSLLGMGYSLEGLGRLLDAEEYFENAAERYPNSGAPMALVKFYWRQDRDTEAKEAVVKYLAYNSPNTFIDGLVDHFFKENLPQRIWPVYQQIFDSPKFNEKIVYLAQWLNIKERFDLALPVWEKFVELKPFPGWQKYLPKFYKCLEKTQSKEAALQKIMQYIPNSLDKHRLMAAMYEEEVYDVAIRLGQELWPEFSAQGAPEGLRAACLQLITLAALKSGENSAALKEMLDKNLSNLNGNLDDVLCINYLNGNLDEQTFLSRITPDKVGMGAYYIGLRRLMNEKRSEAETYFLITREATLKGYGEYHWALAELKKLKATPIKETS